MQWQGRAALDKEKERRRKEDEDEGKAEGGGRGWKRSKKKKRRRRTRKRCGEEKKRRVSGGWRKLQIMMQSFFSIDLLISSPRSLSLQVQNTLSLWLILIKALAKASPFRKGSRGCEVGLKRKSPENKQKIHEPQ